MGIRVNKELERKILDLAASPTTALLLELGEKEFMQAILDLARRNGWTCYHVHFSQRSDPGFFDIWMAKDRIIHVETKTEKGQLTADQCRYRDACLAAGGEWYCWRPSDWPTIEHVLKGTK